MLNDEQAAAAQAEYSALPGVPPDGYSWAHAREVNSVNDWLKEQLTQWPDMKWIRVTHRKEDDTVWLEVWPHRPFKEAPFNPPYTATAQGEEVKP